MRRYIGRGPFLPDAAALSAAGAEGGREAQERPPILPGAENTSVVLKASSTWTNTVVWRPDATGLPPC